MELKTNRSSLNCRNWTYKVNRRVAICHEPIPYRNKFQRFIIFQLVLQVDPHIETRMVPVGMMIAAPSPVSV